MSTRTFKSSALLRPIFYCLTLALLAFSACSEDEAPTPDDGDGAAKADSIIQRDESIALLLADNESLAIAGKAYNVQAFTASIPVRFNASADHLASASIALILTDKPNKKLAFGTGCTEVYLNANRFDANGMAIVYVTGLIPSSTYRYCAYYFYNSKETSLSEQGTLVTADAEDEGLTVDAVDLGLSVKWGSWNVGAARSYQEGRFYKYGLPGSWESDNAGASPTSNVAGTLSDPATAALGAGWQSPTVKQCLELINNCTWVEGVEGGVDGFFVYGKGDYSYNYIFIPKVGYENLNGNLTDNGKTFMLWSGEISSSTDRAYVIKSTTSGNVSSARSAVGYKMPIRPVNTL